MKYKINRPKKNAKAKKPLLNKWVKLVIALALYLAFLYWLLLACRLY